MKAQACAGIRFSHLESVLHAHANGGSITADEFCALLLSNELAHERSGSFADYLLRDAATSHLVKEKADYFVSYVWAVDLRLTFAALRSKFGDDEVYIWMDLFSIDQHAGTKEVIDFSTLESMFGDNLSAIGRAMVVMIPAMNPIATTRAWCCFEWYILVSKQIEYEFCVTPQDEQEFVARVLRGELDFAALEDIFSSVNVRKASARETSDEAAIQALLARIGPVKVNNVVMLSIKSIQRKLVERALESAQEDGPERFRALFAQAELLHVLGEYEAAMKSYQDAVATTEAVGSMVDEKMLTQQRMGALYFTMNQFDDALQVLNATRLVNEARYGRESEQVVQDLKLLGDVYNAQSKFEDALQAFETAWEIHNKIYGEKWDKRMASTLNGLAQAQAKLKRFELAIANYKQGIASIERELGDSHIELLDYFSNLGRVYFDLNQFPEAISLFHRADAIQRMALGEDHFMVANTLLDISNAKFKMGEKREALGLAQRALRMYQACFGEENQKVGLAQENVGYILKSLGEMDAALEAHLAALSIAQAVWGNDHIDAVRVLSNCAGLYYARQDYLAAHDMYVQCVDILSKPVHAERAEVLGFQLAYLGRALLALERYEEAETRFARVLAIFHKCNDMRAQALLDMVSCKCSLQRFSEARDCFQEALDIRTELFGAESEKCAQFHAVMAKALGKAGEYEDALVHLEKCLKIETKLFGPESIAVGRTLLQIGILGRSVKGSLGKTLECYWCAEKIFSAQLPSAEDDLIKVKQALLDCEQRFGSEDNALEGPTRRRKCVIS